MSAAREIVRLQHEHQRLARKIGELDLMLMGLRHLATDAPFESELARLEAIRGMFKGTVRVRAVPTSERGQVKLEFWAMAPDTAPHMLPSSDADQRCLVFDRDNDPAARFRCVKPLGHTDAHAYTFDTSDLASAVAKLEGKAS